MSDRKKLKPIVNSKGLTRKERQAKIRQIAREHDRKLAEIGPRPMTFTKGPAFYLMIIAVFVMIGGAIIQSAGGNGKNAKSMEDRETGQTRRSVNALAEACGRFKYHCGVWPTVEEGGIVALAEKRGHHPGWVGPYVHMGAAANPARWREVANDIWGRPYIYEPPAEGDTNGIPVLLSVGKDGIRGTADDVTPDPELFTKALRDTSWADDWVPFYKRGIIVVPKGGKKMQNGGAK